jgi:DivIVA domain-containing protein
MAISFSRPDPSSPAAVAAANFTVGRRGFDTDEVHEFLRMVAAELARLQERERFLESELRANQYAGSGLDPLSVDEDVVARLLGEEAAKILTTSREAAAQIKARAEENAARIVREATDEAQRVREEAEIEAARHRQDSASDAEAELEMAKQQGREMVNEARAYRERVLGELARRRELARQQIEALVHGRDRLLHAFERARIAAVDVMAEMTPLTEPHDLAGPPPATGELAAAAPPSAQPPAVRVDAPPLTDAAHTAPADADARDDELPAGDRPPPAAAQPADDGAVEPGDADRRRGANVLQLPTQAADGADRAAGADPAPRPSGTAADDTTVLADGRASRPAKVAKVVSLFAGEVQIPGRPARPAPPSAPITAARRRQSADAPADAPADAGTAVASEAPPALDAAQPRAAPDVTAVTAAAQRGDHPVHLPATPARGAVDDLFARLRAARAEEVAARAMRSDAVADDAVADDAVADDASVAIPASATADEQQTDPDAPTPFARRDAELTPLIVAAARKLKRVLADEQNDIMLVLRRKTPVTDPGALLPAADEHAARYQRAVHDDLELAALAGAASLDDSSVAAHRRALAIHDALAPAGAQLTATIVAPLRERVERAVSNAAGDNPAVVEAVRAVYREWKTQRIDEYLEEVFHTAFGRGAFTVLAPGTPVCWTIDPHGPDCADAEDNMLGGTIAAGEPFPTEHLCAPAHEGCRCMLQRARQ